VPDLGNGDWRAWRRGRRDHRVSAPMPYGPAFSPILCRSTQASRESCPTGHRFADPVIGCRARPNPRLRKSQLGRTSRHSCRQPTHERDWSAAGGANAADFRGLCTGIASALNQTCWNARKPSRGLELTPAGLSESVDTSRVTGFIRSARPACLEVYCRSCLPRNAAAVSTSLVSVDPICRGSFDIRTTKPSGSSPA